LHLPPPFCALFCPIYGVSLLASATSRQTLFHYFHPLYMESRIFFCSPWLLPSVLFNAQHSSLNTPQLLCPLFFSYQQKMKSLYSSVSSAASCECIHVPSTLAALLGFGKNSPQVPLAADSRRCTLPIAADSCHNAAFPPAPIGGNRQLSAAIGGENRVFQRYIDDFVHNDFVIALPAALSCLLTPISCLLFSWHHLASVIIS
jgi:hypothetical protein